MTSSFTWKRSGLAAACFLALGVMSGVARAQTVVEETGYLTDATLPAAVPAIGKVWLDADAVFHFDKAELRDRKSTRLNSSHIQKSRMPSSA